MTRKWAIFNDQLNVNYDVGNETISNTKVLNPTQTAFKKCTSFVKCIIKIDRTTIDDAEDLDLVMLVCNFLKYNSNYSDMTSSSC